MDTRDLELKTNLTLQCLLMTCVRWMNGHPMLAATMRNYRMDRWDLEDTPDTEERVLKIAKERYRGWRSTLSSTYKAYKTDAARLANLPEDLQPQEWEWMIQYFGTDSKFKERSQMNTNNRKKQKTKHRIGSKSYSQVSLRRETRKLKKSQIVLLCGNSPTRRTEHGLTQSHKKFT